MFGGLNLDFGILKTGERQVIVKELKNEIDFPFDFRFDICSPNGEPLEEDFPLTVRPSKGVIPGNHKIRIEFIFQPNRPRTDILETIFRLNEYQYKPIKVIQIRSWF